MVTTAHPLRVDTHVHVFERHLSLAPDRRYEPDYDANCADLRKAIGGSGIGRVVLVQPSFLGTDNSYLLRAIASDRTTFAGVAVIDPGLKSAALDDLRRSGVVGVRLNFIGQTLLDFSHGALRCMSDRLAASGLVLEIQAEAGQWSLLAPFLKQLPCAVLVDHFGRTPPNHRSAGFESLLQVAQDVDHLWFKFSAPYRVVDGRASDCARTLLSTVGLGRIVWGSDWPWTQFEGRQSYRETLEWLEQWIPRGDDRQRVLADNPTRLFGLQRPDAS